ncbi:MAG: hypothetical protein A2X58_13290 [Nitrospirae bacterium GWC2_56_14]|nr:MAG: hypothetical protein A2X58_13290 [Nitrospirae bacterium GWC2_56_14]
MPPKIAILILNWNGWEDTLCCLESVLRLPLPVWRTIVIDNGSGNDSVSKILEWAQCPPDSLSGRTQQPVNVITYDRVTAERGGSAEGEESLADSGPRKFVLIKTGSNFGFAGGNNIGIRYALAQGAEYILLLNNDAYFRSPDALAAMVGFMERTPSAGACGGRYFYPNGEPQQSYGNFPTLLRILAYLFPLYKLLPPQWLKGFRRSNVIPDERVTEPLLVDWPSGACLLVRAEAIEDVGMLDDRFFLYMEEPDWCLRMKKQDWDRYYLPQAEVIHAFGGSVNKTSTSMRQYHLESQFKYFRKHFPAPAMAVFAAGYFVRSSFSLLSWRLSCIAGEHSGQPSPDIQFWQQAWRLSAAEFRSLLPARVGGQSQTTAASTAVRTT